MKRKKMDNYEIIRRQREGDLQDKKEELFESIEPLSVFTSKKQTAIEGLKPGIKFLVGVEKVGDSWPAIKLTPANIKKIFDGVRVKTVKLTIEDMVEPFSLGISKGFKARLKRELRKVEKV